MKNTMRIYWTMKQSPELAVWQRQIVNLNGAVFFQEL